MPDMTVPSVERERFKETQPVSGIAVAVVEPLQVVHTLCLLLLLLLLDLLFVV